MKTEGLTHKILVAAASAILTAIIGYIFSSFVLKPEYTSTSRYYVLDQTEKIYSGSEKSADAYTHFFSSYAFLDKVAEDSRLGYTSEQLNKMVRVSAVENSSFLDITVTANNASDTFQIQQSILKKQESYIRSITDGTITTSVVDQARIPSSPSSPDVILISLCFSAIGTLSGILFSFIFSASDNHIQSVSDITSRFSYPVLSCIPSFSNTDISLTHMKTHRKYSELNSYNPILINDRTSVGFTDSFRKLSLNLSRTLPDTACKVLTVSSSVAGEGKTTVAVNLAVTIAHSGARVLIIECDLRNGKIRSFFGIHGNQPGISNVIYGTLSSKDVIVLTEYDSLFVLCAGTVLHNPASILSSPDMSYTVNQLKPMFDYIIIDTPPVNAVSDVLTLTQISDGVVIVARRNHTIYSDIEKAIKSFELADTNISGFILNDTDETETRREIRNISHDIRFSHQIQNYLN